MNATLPPPAQPAARRGTPVQATAPPSPAATDRLPFEFETDEHTVETWAAYITCPALAEFHAIRTAAAQVAAAAAEWRRKYGAIADPGADAIRAAGLTPPGSVAEFGTVLRDARGCLADLIRGAESFVRDVGCTPDPTKRQNDPANVARILAARAGQGKAR